jgi:hypothetical protein
MPSGKKAGTTRKKRTTTRKKSTTARKKTASTRKKTATSRKKTARKKSSRKYSPATAEVVHEEMHEFKEGRLRSGRSGKKVTDPKQAIAIGLSEARREGKKVPPNPNRDEG